MVECRWIDFAAAWYQIRVSRNLNRRRKSMSTQTYSPTSEKQPGFIPATRQQQSFLAAAEKRCLLWLAERTPRWLNSDHLTLLGFAAQCMAGACYAFARWNRFTLLLGIVFLALNW